VNLPILVSGMATYMGVGWYLYVPYAVANRTERLAEHAREHAAERTRWLRREIEGTYSAARARPMGSDAAAVISRLYELERTELAEIDAAPILLDVLRRQAARRWPLYCLIWLPAVLALLVWAASVWVWRSATSRAVTRAASPAVKPQVSVGGSEIERLERELKDEFGIVFGGEVTP
jgi:Flp pilus assembly protein TadB